MTAKRPSIRKPVPSRTKISRAARRLRRDFFTRQAEYVFFLDNPTAGTPDEIARAKKRFEAIEAKVDGVTFLAAKLEVKPALALAELEGDDEGEEN
jgi:hypothetical protein